MAQNQEKQKSKEKDPKKSKILELTDKFKTAVRNMCRDLKNKMENPNEEMKLSHAHTQNQMEILKLKIILKMKNSPNEPKVDWTMQNKW